MIINFLLRHSLWRMASSHISVEIMCGLTALAILTIMFSVCAFIVCIGSEDDGPKTIMTFLFIIAVAILLLIVMYINIYVSGSLVVIIANIAAHKHLEAKRKMIHG